jgi:integrase
VGRGYLEANPAAAISKPSKERSRDRTPTLPELREIWKATAQLGYPFGPIVRLLILTAARRGEIGAMRLAEVEYSAETGDACWILPAERSKNGRAIRVPLPAAAADILRDVRSEQSPKGPYFFTTTGRKPVAGWTRAKARLDAKIAANRRAEGRAADISPWRLHDLRRSFATGACDLLKIDPVVADRCLNHVGSSTTSTISRVYARSEMFEQRREALSRWAALVTKAVE